MVEAADVILHVLDARDPIATRSIDVEQYVCKAGPDKRVVLLLNKIGALMAVLDTCMHLYHMWHLYTSSSIA